MQRTFAVAVAVGTILCATALARQAATSSSQQTPASSTTKSASATNGKSAQAAGTSAKSGSTSGLPSKKDKQSYAVGANFGLGLKQQSLDLDPALVAQGVKDALSGTKLAISNEEARDVLNELQAELQKNQEARMTQFADANKKEGAAFLTANKTKQGVVTLPDGLQYKILKQGTGSKPTAGDTVVCNYRGTLINGKEFDSSYKRGQSASFPVSGVIRGWTEALQLMPVGSQWQLFVPSELAYGDRGAGPDIGPGSTLIFEVELLSIQNKK